MQAAMMSPRSSKEGGGRKSTKHSGVGAAQLQKQLDYLTHEVIPTKVKLQTDKLQSQFETQLKE